MANVASSSSVASSRLRFWLPRLVTAILAPILVLALAEGALRLFHVGHSTTLMEPCKIHGQAYACYNLFFAAPFFPPGMIKTPQFFSIPLEKSQNTYRIFILGESAAMGDPDFAYGFSRYLQVMLRQRFPSVKFEIVNAGMVAINSHVLLEMTRQFADYHPDLFIVYAGSNEVVGPYGPGTVLTGSSMNPTLIRASIFVRSTRIGQLLTESGKPRTEWRGMEMFLNKQVRVDSPRMERAYRNFTYNIKEIANVATASGAHVVLSTIATNLRDTAPFASMHRDDLSPENLQTWSSFVNQGTAFESVGAYSDALKAYNSAAQLDDQFAELQFRIARCEWAMGDYAAAKERYVRARDLDTLRFRADSRINEIIRTTATSSGANVQLLDAQSLFATQSHNGVTGSELLYDHVHPTPPGNYILALTAYEHIANLLPPNVRTAVAGADPLSEVECEKLLAFTGHDRARVASEMVDRLQRPPFTNQLNHAEQVQSLMLRATGVTESPQETAAQYQWAIAQTPDDLTLHYKFGFFLFDYDRMAAAQQLVLARPNDDFPVFLPDGTQIQ
jgi:tetratricopeptide (TPR) repeat protein